MDGITFFVIILTIGYICFLIIEKVYYTKIRKSFKYVIHVNGIRGKSTTTRLIDAGLRGCGFRVFSKTTGTIPMYIDTNNQIHQIKRRGLANIREQLRMMKQAYKEKAEILVLECMAVNPDLQAISEQMIKADINIIINVRNDHLNEMGNSLEQIAKSLSNTIPMNGYVIIGETDYEQIFYQIAHKNKSQLIVAKPYEDNNLMSTFPINLACSLAVCNILNLDINTYKQAMNNYYHDPGAYCEIKYQQTIFLNGFSINDPDSILLVYQEIIKKYDPTKITILWINRQDRAFRTIQHLAMFKHMQYKKIIVGGSYIDYVIKKLQKQKEIDNNSTTIEAYTSIETLLQEEVIFAIGNIVGLGMTVLDYFKERGEINDR